LWRPADTPIPRDEARRIVANTAKPPELLTTPRRSAAAPATAIVTIMLTRITCPNCGHIGAATAESLPRVLICSQCGHGAFIRSGRPARLPSITSDEQAALRAAWERYEVVGVK
jgi:hypothetical protein